MASRKEIGGKRREGTVGRGRRGRPGVPADDRGRPRPGARGALRRLLVAVGMGSGLLLGACGFREALVRSPLFVLRQVEVEGTRRLSPQEVRAWGGVRPGANLLTLDPARVARRLERSPWIRDAAVVKRLPDRLLIRVRERTPAAVVSAAGRLFYVDEEGCLLEEVRPGERLDYPVVTGVEGVAPGRRGCGKTRGLQEALSLLRALGEVFPDRGVSEIHVDASEGLSLFFEGVPWAVRVGWRDYEGKLERLGAVFPRLAGRSRSIASVDLRFAGQVLVRPAGRGRTTGSSSLS